MAIKSKQSLLKFSAIGFGVILLFAILASYFSHHDKVQRITTTINNPKRLNDNTTGDTANETLQTLIAENSQLKDEIAQQKSALDQVQHTTHDNIQSTQQNLSEQVSSLQSQLSAISDKLSSVMNQNSAKNKQRPDNNFVWLNDESASPSATTTAVTTDDNSTPDTDERNPGLKSAATQAVKQTNSNFVLSSNTTAVNSDKSAVDPYMTIPENATLTDAIALQPLVGRIPRNGIVTNPRNFKFMVEANNMAANGVNIPPDLKGAVGRARCEGDLLSSSVTCDVVSLTFVFQDGRIATVSSTGDNDSLGTVSDEYGDPLIKGKLVSDAGLYLAGIAATSGVQAYGNALSAAQTATTTEVGGTPATLTQMIGSSKLYAAGQAINGAAEATQQWWQQRVQSSYDYVYVPNFSNSKLLHININITKQLAIDYDKLGRKVSYGTSPLAEVAKSLD